MTDKKIEFDMEAALEALRSGKGVTGKDGVLTPLIKQLTEAAMKAELARIFHQTEKTRLPLCFKSDKPAAPLF